MPIGQPLNFLSQTHILGRRSRERMLDKRDFPVLHKAPIQLAGHGVLRAPYHMVRMPSPHTHVYASLSGCGRVLIDGREEPFGPGKVLVTPAGVNYAYAVAGAGPWATAWLFFADNAAAPVTRSLEPRLFEAEVHDFAELVGMLTREASGLAQPSMLEALMSLLDTTTRRMAGIEEMDMRLSRMWVKVEADLAHAWNCTRLASAACMSEEHLRRLSHKYYQGSPMEHLTQLRMRRAGALLRSTPAKLEDIARQVGYGSVYSFSVAFSRWSGVPPARYRRAGAG